MKFFKLDLMYYNFLINYKEYRDREEGKKLIRDFKILKNFFKE